MSEKHALQFSVVHEFLMGSAYKLH